MPSATGNVRSVCLVPTGLLTFEGKVLPNAYAFADLNGDNDIELVVGSMAGKMAGLSSSESAYGHSVDGCITAIVAHASADRRALLFVTTAEGQCIVLQKQADADAFATIEQFAIPLNVSAAAVIKASLVLGTRDATIHTFNIANVHKAFEEKKVRVPGEVESMLRQGDAGKVEPLVVCLHTGAVLKFNTMTSRVQLQEPWDGAGRAFALTQIKSDGVVALDAFGRLDGSVELRHAASGEALWSLQLPDALLMMATITLFQDGDEEIALCCWNGDVYLVNKAGSQLRFSIPFSITAFFTGAFAQGGQDTLFCATTSGGILYYSGIGQSIRHIRHHSVLEAIETAGLLSALDTPAKRQALLAALALHVPHLAPVAAPSLPDCLRALVYASSSLLATPPVVVRLAPAPDDPAPPEQASPPMLPASPIESALLVALDQTPPAPRTKKGHRKQRR
ncbi:hypothetical protein ACHHYP_02051 [Achlya hypogyna]|uniref:Uncharacterized protein n=1 Tax=Achlya hypogyna TaxID=1202772 RepID=A0A1V9ZSG2_ACHHY|nr:hypothetical protein ACHHYP_02051 [Achlya hypogyna]